jgi:hypothetical protein
LRNSAPRFFDKKGGVTATVFMQTDLMLTSFSYPYIFPLP